MKKKSAKNVNSPERVESRQGIKNMKILYEDSK